MQKSYGLIVYRVAAAPGILTRGGLGLQIFLQGGRSNIEYVCTKTDSPCYIQPPDPSKNFLLYIKYTKYTYE